MNNRVTGFTYDEANESLHALRDLGHSVSLRQQIVREKTYYQLIKDGFVVLSTDSIDELISAGDVSYTKTQS